MFQFLKEPIVWINVEWEGLDEEGVKQTNTIRMRVLLVPASEIEQMPQSTEATSEFIKRVARDWSQIVGPDRKPFPFTAENLALILEHTPGFKVGFVASYLSAWFGQGKARREQEQTEQAPEPAAARTKDRNRNRG